MGFPRRALSLPALRSPGRRVELRGALNLAERWLDMLPCAGMPQRHGCRGLEPDRLALMVSFVSLSEMKLTMRAVPTPAGSLT